MSLERVYARTDAYQALYSMSWKIMLAIVLPHSVLPRNSPPSYFPDCRIVVFEQSHPWLPILFIHSFVYLFPILVPSSRSPSAGSSGMAFSVQMPGQSVQADVYVKEYAWDEGNQKSVYPELPQQPSVTLCKQLGLPWVRTISCGFFPCKFPPATVPINEFKTPLLES